MNKCNIPHPRPLRVSALRNIQRRCGPAIRGFPGHVLLLDVPQRTTVAKFTLTTATNWFSHKEEGI